jgi:TrmH family RNA methyltransferase
VISSKNNPVISHYHKLCENKRCRRTEKLFPAEGLRLVREAVQAGNCGDILLTESARERFGEEFPDAWRITDELGRYIADTEHPQGVFCICRMPELRFEEQPLHPDGRYLVTCDLQDPGNMGMILRTADALGIDAVLACRSCEVYSPKVVRATMGAIFRQPVYELKDTAELSAALREAGIRSYAAVLHRDARPVQEYGLGKGCAVWIGNEGNGLSDEAVAVCEEKIIIPMPGNAESLNAAMAAGILMWEMTKSGE